MSYSLVHDKLTSSRLRLCDVGKKRIKIITNTRVRAIETSKNSGVTLAIISMAESQEVTLQIRPKN